MIKKGNYQTPDSSKQSRASSSTNRLLFIVVVGLAALVTFQYRDKIRLPKFIPSFPTRQAPTPTPTPTALMQGKETYSISQASDNAGPKITKAEIDPLDPKVGGKQTITIHSNFTKPVTAVTVSIKTDNKTFPLTLTRVSGTDTNGQWQTSWTVEDTFLYTYIMTITAQSGDASSKVDLAIRS